MVKVHLLQQVESVVVVMVEMVAVELQAAAEVVDTRVIMGKV
jgi:hypothetical protein